MLRNVDLSPSPWLPSSAILCQDVCGLCVKKYAGGFQTLNASRIFFWGKSRPQGSGASNMLSGSYNGCSLCPRMISFCSIA